MRVNISAEEMTDRVEIISKQIDGQTFTGLRLYLELPASFIHHPGDDDSAEITFWGKTDLRETLKVMMAELDKHYANRPARTLP